MLAALIKKNPSQVDETELPRKRRIPKRLENDEANAPHNFKTPKEYFNVPYSEVCGTVKLCITNRLETTGLDRLEIAVEKECLLVIRPIVQYILFGKNLTKLHF